jgi:hypothetical protein
MSWIVKPLLFLSWLLILTQTACIRKKKTSEASSLGNNPILTTNTYLESCRKALGEIPEIDCNKGTEIIMFDPSEEGHKVVTRSEATAPLAELCKNRSFGQTTRKAACRSGSKIGRLTNDKGTEWSYLCRSNQSNIWSQVGLIGHLPSTGETCFFEKNQLLNSANGIISSPSEDLSKNNSEPRQWESVEQLVLNTTSGHCVTCHAARPFLRTQYALTNEYQAAVHGKEFTGPTTVFSTPMKTTLGAKYVVLHARELNKLSGIDAWSPKKAVGEAISFCTGCHDVGGQATFRELAPGIIGYALGNTTSDPFENLHLMLHPKHPGVKAAFASQNHSKIIAALESLKTCKSVGSPNTVDSPNTMCQEEFLNADDAIEPETSLQRPQKFMMRFDPLFEKDSVTFPKGKLTISFCQGSSHFQRNWQGQSFFMPAPSFLCQADFANNDGSKATLTFQGITLQSAENTLHFSTRANVSGYGISDTEKQKYSQLLGIVYINLTTNELQTEAQLDLEFCKDSFEKSCENAIEFPKIKIQ